MKIKRLRCGNVWNGMEKKSSNYRQFQQDEENRKISRAYVQILNRKMLISRRDKSDIQPSVQKGEWKNYKAEKAKVYRQK